MIKKTITLLSLSLSLMSWGQQTIKFASTPTLSPDAKTAYFSFNGDLWSASTISGKAQRITALDGQESKPRVSPDGKWLAFTSMQNGNKDVFVMPVEGGEIKQLTFHQANEEVEGWSWDSKTIYFTSNAENRFASFSIDKDGGTPVRMFDNYFNTTNGLVETPAKEFLFTNSSESESQTTRKRYKGENNPDILGYNPQTKQYKQYTNYNGKDFHASVDNQGNIYFISDRGNGHFNLYTLVNGEAIALTDYTTSIGRPFVNAQGTKVIFEKDYDLYLYDIAAKKAEPLSLTLNNSTTLEKDKAYEVASKISNFNVSPDQKKIAFISRGIVFVSDIEGKFVQQITDGKERAMEVKWLKDNTTLLYSQTYQGFQNWFTIDAKQHQTPVQLTFDAANNRDITLNDDLTKAVYISGRDKVVLLDLGTKKSTVLVEDEIWGFQNSKPSFSPDGQYVLFTAKRNFEEDIFVHHLQDKTTVNLTNTGVSESNPVWSQDGKYIYFTSDRLNPSYPFGMQNPSIYRFPIDWLSDGFASDEFDKLFAEQTKATADTKKKKNDKAKEAPTAKKLLKLNTKEVLDRIELVSSNFARQQAPSVFNDKDKEYVYFTSNQDNGKFGLHRKIYQDFEKDKSEQVWDKPLYSLQLVDKTLYGLSGQDANIYKFALDKGKPAKIDISYTFTKNLQQEFEQIFYETWAGVEENFYDGDFHGLDWQQTKLDFAQYLPYINNRQDLRVLLNDMLGELNSSHLGFNSTGEEEKTKLNAYSYEIGAVFDKTNPYKIERIVRKSPAYASNVDLQKGDIITKVNDVEVQADQNRDQYFSFPYKAKEIKLTIIRDAKEKVVKVHPIAYAEFRDLLYDEWIDANKNRVDELSDGKIAYSYMKNMSTQQLESFLLDMVEQENRKEGVILDLRFNTGGNVHDKVLNFLAQRPYLQWKYRDGKMALQSNFNPSGKPIVLLINEYSLSDAEMTAAGFKALKLGKIIGQETYRWIIFTSAKSLVDGSSYRLPGWGTYTLEGDNLEKTGVAPDIYVKNTFLDRLTNNDPQLERAVKEILQDIR